MKSFFEKPSLKAQSHRNPFDLSYQYQNTLPFGAILPCGFWQVNPNDKIRLSNEYQIVCDALVRPAFTRLKAHINYYFVPATQIWMQFDNFITGQGSYISSAVRDVQGQAGAITPNTVPTFTGQFLREMFNALGQKVDELGYPMHYGAARLLDALGYHNFYGWLNNGTLDDLADTTDFTLLPNMNFFALACYQKVYYDYFRNPLYEDNKTSAYNLDRLNGVSAINAYTTAYEDLFKLHYRWLKRDYFTQTQPNSLVTSTQLGYQGLKTSLSSMTSVFGVPGLAIDDPASLGISAGAYGDTSNVGYSTQTGGYNSNTTPSKPRITVANIRTAFAFDRLLRRMREAGADFDKQMLAQFGVAPYDARHGKCYHIGGFVNQLQTDSITNNAGFASGMGDSLGELAGQINYYGNNTGKTLEYHVKEMGFVIGVISISNENTYQSYRTNRYNLLKDRFDWFNPVFEDLGLQPLFQGELDNTDATSTGIATRGRSISQNTKNIIGYIRRYSELKTKPDEIHGNLCYWSNVFDLTAWNMQYYRGNWQVQQYGAGTPLNISDLLTDPAMMDSVVGVPYTGDPQTDPFILNLYNHFHVVSSMSRLGENF